MPTGIFIHKPHSEEYKKKMSLTLKGHIVSEETRKKISETLKGNIPWNKGKSNWRMKGKPRSEATKKKISLANKGKKRSEETKKKIREVRKRQDMKNHPNWKGGITPITKQIRQSIKYKQWRQDVFIKDNFTCQECGQIGGNLEAHHIKPFHKFIKEVKKYLPLLPLFDGAMTYTPLWDLNNGITLCEKCHNKTKRGGVVIGR